MKIQGEIRYSIELMSWKQSPRHEMGVDLIKGVFILQGSRKKNKMTILWDSNDRTLLDLKVEGQDLGYRGAFFQKIEKDLREHLQM